MATIPKLALIPSGYKAGKLYSVLPTDGSGDLDFARTTTATRINKNGLIENVGNNVPRLDYEGGGCPSLLLEPTSRNLIIQSEAFDNSSWVKLSQGIGSAPIVTPNYAISPNGTLNASRLQCDLNGGNTTNDRSWLYQSISTINGDNTFSLYVKNNSNEDTTFSLTNGSSETVVVLSDDKWHRLSTVRSGGGQPRIGLIGGVGASDNADLLIYGAQIEQQSSATSYIPNFGTIEGVSRSADTANGAGNASTFNDSEGVLMVETSILDFSTSDSWISISENSNINNNQFNLRFISNSNIIQSVSRANGLGQDVVLQHTINDKTAVNKISIKYKLNDWGLWVNGFEVDTETSSNDFTPNSLDVLDFDRGNNSKFFYGKTKQLQYFNTALTDLELETLTSYTSFNEMALAQNYIIQ